MLILLDLESTIIAQLQVGCGHGTAPINHWRAPITPANRALNITTRAKNIKFFPAATAPDASERSYQ